MALQDMPLSDLQSAVSVGNSDLLYLVQNGESKKLAIALLLSGKADLVNGLLPLYELPNSVVTVANATERFALDSDDVNNGFIVLQAPDTDDAKMFLVVDNTNLDSEAGYQPFAADAVWGNIINRPTNLAYLAGDDEELPSVSPVLRESSLQNNLATTLPGYPLDARQGKVLDDKITTLNSNLTELKNNVAGSQISLETYTSSTNKYTFLNDGYIYINSGTATSSAIRVVVVDAAGSAFITKYIPLTSAVVRDALYVRKGMSVYCDNVPSGSTIKFVPLISYQ